MTVSSDLNKISYAGNGTTTVFAVNYYFLADAHLQVVLIAANGTETVQTLTTNYTVSGAGNPAGGSVTMLVAPPTGTSLVIQRNVPATQETDYLANDPFPAESHERALDKLTMLTQQNERDANRAIKFPIGDSTTINNVLQPAATRATKLLGFSAGGDVALTNSTINQVDAAVASFVNATGNNAASILYDPAGSGAVQTTVQAKLRETVSVKDFGAVGDGVTDDTAAFAAFLANKGNWKLERGATYKLTDGFDLEDTVLDLNGSTLDFTTTGNTYPIRLLSNSGVKNGRIVSNGSSWGAAGNFGSPISIGEYIGGSLQQNIFVDSVSLYSAERACVYIVGDVSNVTVNNVVIEDSATMTGIPIVAHWGRDLADPAFTKLYHPRNVTISNIEVGKVPLSEHGIGVSSGYNFNISNVRIKECGGAALWAFVGDFGFEQDSDPDALESLHGMAGITADNIICYKSLVGISVTDRSPAISPFSAATWPVQVVVTNSVFFGPDDVAETTAYGVIFGGQVTVENCKFYNFYQGTIAYRPVSNVFVRNSEFKNMFAGMLTTSQDFGSSTYKNFNFKSNVIANCNRGSVASLRLFNLIYVSGFTFDANQVDMTGATSTILAVAAYPSENITVTNNIFSGCTSGNFAIVIASGLSTGVGRVIANNTLDAASAGTLYGGEVYPTSIITPWGNVVGYRVDVPVIGTWKRGDIFFNSEPSAGGAPGWMCTAGGTPGTWKAMANLAA